MTWRCRSTPSFSATSGRAAASRPPASTCPKLLDAVLDGRINPGRVFDFETDLDHIVDAYDARDNCTAIKSLVRVEQSASP